MKEGKLFENLPEFVKVAKSLRAEKIRFKAEKRIIGSLDEFEVLDGLRILGADGSQISPLKEFGIPIGGVQSAGITVHHGKGEFEVKYLNKIVFDQYLELERFRLEVEIIKQNLEKVDFAFYDGSLSALYLSELSERLSMQYRKEIEELVMLSEKYQTPVIGYADRSYMRDLGLGIYDSYVLSDFLDISEYLPAIRTSSPLIAMYIKVNPSLPVRVEIPEWCEGMQDEIAKVIMAECRLGSTKGYPYILERAHKYAKISEGEKRAFMRAVKSSGISFKYISKVIE
ncbi:DNA double-strand break repair nuclease NurA [Geoglobus acetivorans]|uniref:NurA domain-containing protein n=1 Tax=Geoglobus acetivorans TaxID=565033 RepID=A0A0A7GFJ1_GEOAI|nr:hypothetical protein GACE_1598 [Geoglobus acetivorans]